MTVFWWTLPIALVSAAALVSSQDLKHETVDLWGKLELNCDLAEYTDLVEQGLVNISWEAMGKDVVSYDGNHFFYGPEFGPRVSAKWDPAGAFSVTLDPVVLSDADMYECLLQSRKTLSTVIVSVVRDTAVESLIAEENEDVTLPCHGKISKSSTLDKVSVYWKRNGTVIYSVIDGKPPNRVTFWYNDAFIDPARIQIYGDLSLHIHSVSKEESGFYECSYSNKNFASDTNAGTVSLTVVERLTSEEVWNDDMSPLPTVPTPGTPEQESLEVSTVVTSRPQTYAVVVQVQDTIPPETSIDARAEEETGSEVPWVLIGVISGVLILTALILGPLVAMGKI